MISLLGAAIVASTAYGLNQDVRKNFGENRFIAIPREEVTDVVFEILESHGVDQLGHHDNDFHFKMAPGVRDLLESEGVSFDDHTEEFLSNMERNLKSENFICSESSSVCASKSLEDFHSQYQTMDSIHARFESIAATNPSLTTLEDFGQSFEGRTSKVLWIGDDGEKPLIFYLCTTHAREWITPMYCTFMAESLLDGSAQSEQLLDRFSFAIVPIVNPDGFVYSYERDNAWRKTRKPNEGSRCVGTDANRNYPVGHKGPGSSGNRCSDTYHGEFPFDNPCTNNVRIFTEAHQDRIVHVNDVHSYGEYFLSPYSGTREMPPDADKHAACSASLKSAIKAETGLDFTTGPSAQTLYVANGVSGDYFYTGMGITHSYIYEARGGGRSGIAGFQPPVSNIMPSNLELYAGFVAVANCVFEQEVLGEAPRGVDDADVDESSSGNDISGLVAVVVILGLAVVIVGLALFAVVKRVTKLEADREEHPTHFSEARVVGTKNPMASNA